MLPLLLLLQADPATLVDKARQMTSAERRCVYDPTATDITVCGLRNADRFRAPLASTPARRDNVPEERGALTRARTPMQDMGPFLVGGGAAGVRATIGVPDGPQVGGMRPPAP